MNCSIIGQILEVKENRSISDGKVYYSLKFLLTDNKVSVMFFKEKELFDSLSKVDRLSAIELNCDLSFKDEYTFRCLPKAFKM